MRVWESARHEINTFMKDWSQQIKINFSSCGLDWLLLSWHSFSLTVHACISSLCSRIIRGEDMIKVPSLRARLSSQSPFITAASSSSTVVSIITSLDPSCYWIITGEINHPSSLLYNWEMEWWKQGTLRNDFAILSLKICALSILVGRARCPMSL